MDRILVPTDFSTCAENATQVAKEIAKRTGAAIHFLHFTAIPIDWVNLHDEKGKMYPDVTKKVKQCQDQLNQLIRASEKEGIKASSYIGYNESYQNIIDSIKNDKIDLVVMGSHGASGLKGAILGSNAQKVIRLSPVPVFVIKQNTPHFDMKKIAVMSNFPEESDDKEAYQSFTKLLEVANALDLDMDLLFINTPAGFISSKTMKKRMESYKKRAGDSINIEMHIINANNLEEGIADYLDENDHAFIGMMTHGETGLNRFFKGSQVETLANHTEAPVLTVRM